MLNKYPLWKNLMIIAVLVFGFIYALPNIYGEDLAIQISGARGVSLENKDIEKIEKIIKEDCKDCFIDRQNGQALIRFTDNDLRLKVKDKLTKNLGVNYVVALNLAPATPMWLRDIGARPLKLGLDLRGGLHFLMEIDMNEAIKKIVNQTIQDFRAELREEKIRLSGAKARNHDVVVSFRDEKTKNDALNFLKDKHTDMLFTDESTSDSFSIVATMKPEKLKEIRTYAVEQNINIIRNRVNELGVAEPLVQRQGADRIVVELPGIEDSARAKEILGATATLEFRLVDQATDLEAAASGQISSNSEVLESKDGMPVVVRKQVILTGDHIVDAKSGMDENSRPEVSISLDSKGGSIMSEFTKDHIGQPMATNFIEYKVVEDEEGKNAAAAAGVEYKVKFKKVEQIINVATIQSRLGTKFRITGLDSTAEARNLALLLRAGALIAPIQIVEERNIGPSLGKQNIESGMKAMLWGLIFLSLFMVFYYKMFGLIANIALVFNFVLLVGVMSMIPGATMTLPGIAGIVLTIGMAVDANVLIYERIREEIRNGRGIQQAINLGYERAFATIADSNITSFLVALVLFLVGTGAVKGFALVLMIGLGCSMFTAVTACRAIVNVIWGGRKVEKLWI